jgi:hypothetical protein
MEIIEVNDKTDEETNKENTEDQRCGSERLSRKQSKPKAFEFWEGLANNDQPPPQAPPVDFRYNTIHRMSTGRRQLPKPPPKESVSGTSDQAQASQHLNHLRSQSLDRTMMDTSDSRVRTEGSSLNSR